MEERELIHKAKKGEFHAFDELVKLYSRRVFSFAYYQVRNRADAEDISQEVFWRVFSYLKKYDESRKFFSWIYAIEMNVIKSFVSKQKHHVTGLDEEFIDTVIFNDGGVLSVDDKLLLFQSMEKLEENEKMMLYFKYIDNLSIQEISEYFGLSEENVKVKLHRTKEKLANIIAGGKL